VGVPFHLFYSLVALVTAQFVGAVPAAVHLPIAAVAVLLDEGQTPLQSLAHLGPDAPLAQLVGSTSLNGEKILEIKYL